MNLGEKPRCLVVEEALWPPKTRFWRILYDDQIHNVSTHNSPLFILFSIHLYCRMFIGFLINNIHMYYTRKQSYIFICWLFTIYTRTWGGKPAGNAFILYGNWRIFLRHSWPHSWGTQTFSECPKWYFSLICFASIW